MKILKNIFIIGIVFATFSCEEYLDLNPKGSIGDAMLNNAEMVENQIIAAYAHVEHDNRNQSPWWFSDLRSGDAYKGGGGISDQGWAHQIETSVLTEAQARVNEKWQRHYIAVSRANSALSILNSLSESEFPLKTRRIAEMRFLRSFQLIQLKQIFNRIVWVDETMGIEQLLEESNVKYTSQEMWDLIIADFRFAADNLPEDNVDVGRVNKFSATAFLVKALMFAAWEKDDVGPNFYTITNVNQTKLQEVINLINWIQSRNRYILQPDFAMNFLWAYRTNGSTEVSESVFAVQSSHDDGTDYGKLNQFSLLSYPQSPEYGCCTMHMPSQNLVNAFKTDPVTGLPLFDTFNEGAQLQYGNAVVSAVPLITVDADLTIDGNPDVTVDPRLMHTVAFVGKPYKYDVDYPLPLNGLRDGTFYGTFLSLKEVETFNCPCYRSASFFRGSSLKRDLIRWAEVLLWKAEALIEIGGGTNLEEAREIINSLRRRAQNSTDRLVMADGTPSANFHIGEYPAAGWDQDFARKALRWEVRLEMAMEGKHGFDLVRWGVLADTMNEYYRVEHTRRTGYMNANTNFQKHKREYFPIPNTQITNSRRLYVQNPNYEQI